MTNPSTVRRLFVHAVAVIIDIVFWLTAAVAAFIAESLGTLWGYSVGETSMMDRRLEAFRGTLAEMICQKPRHPWDVADDDSKE